ncbi:MAG TPA: DinB family protein [Ktedonobacterales bacterium]|jgi:hypothetical protein|nr:DinB family protein [Ktedonobacterales bacterium]
MANNADQYDLYDLSLGVLDATPAALSALLEPVPQDLWEWSPAPDEWSISQLLAHMLHVETAVIPVRVRRMIEQDDAPLVAGGAAAPTSSPRETLAAWMAAREQNLAFLKALTPAQLAHGGIHPRYGRITAREHIIEWAYHDLEHLRQLEATIEMRLYPAIGGFRALYQAPYPGGEQSS